MTNEIKEILDKLKIKNDRYSHHLKYNTSYENKDEDYEAYLLLDYITNLQEKLEVAQGNEEIFRLEMQDITKILGLDENTIFDEVKEHATNLQEENKRLSRTIIDYDELLMQKNNIINKALGFLENCNTKDEELVCYIIKLLKGEDKNNETILSK